MYRELLTAQFPLGDRTSLATVLLEDGKPAELYLEGEAEDPPLFSIYKGKIETIDPKLNAAFVRIQKNQLVYLPLQKGDISFKPGDELPVQIIQEAHKSKLPRASTCLSLSGRFLVLQSGSGQMYFSRRLRPEEKLRMQSFSFAFDKKELSLLFRTAAGSASEESMQDELQKLTEQMRQIRHRATNRICFSVLYRAPCLQERILQNYDVHSWQRIMTDSPAVWQALQQNRDDSLPEPTLYTDPTLPLFRLHTFSTWLDHALQKEITLPSGGSITIEQTEAFVSIDVNSARFEKKKEQVDVVRLTNQEAAREAMRQIRLRQLSGTILIDFINSRGPSETDSLRAILEEEAAKDPVSVRVVDFTSLFICEITRKKQYRPIAEQVRVLRG